MVAAEAGADYVSFGPLTASALGDGEVADPDLFVWWSEMIQTPIVAEGGMTSEIARALAPTVDFLALDQMVWDHPEGPSKALKSLLD
jgi:thiamine-phosphate pyrophosphorylase